MFLLVVAESIRRMTWDRPKLAESVTCRVCPRSTATTSLPVPRCTPMYPDVPRCTPMYPDVPRCTPMYPDVPLCTPLYPVVPCRTRLRWQWRCRRRRPSGGVASYRSSRSRGGRSGAAAPWRTTGPSPWRTAAMVTHWQRWHTDTPTYWHRWHHVTDTATDTTDTMLLTLCHWHTDPMPLTQPLTLQTPVTPCYWHYATDAADTLTH